MILMRSGSWRDVHRDELGSLLGGAGYSNCYPPPQYEGKDLPSHGKHTQINKYLSYFCVVPWNFCCTVLDPIKPTYCPIRFGQLVVFSVNIFFCITSLLTLSFHFVLSFTRARDEGRGRSRGSEWGGLEEPNRDFASPIRSKWSGHLWAAGAKTQLCQCPYHHDGKVQTMKKQYKNVYLGLQV